MDTPSPDPILILPDKPDLFESETERDLAEIVEGIRLCPEFFYEDLLGETLDPQQKPVIASVQANRRTAVKSGHSAGKDFLAGREALRFHLSYYPSRVLITAPTGRQAKEIVWSELARAYHRLQRRFPVGGKLLESGALKYPDKQLEDVHTILAFSTDDASKFTGYHAPNVLVIVSEAQGMHSSMWRAVESLLTGTQTNRLLLIGNPLPDVSGEFYQAFHGKRSLYECLTMDSRLSAHCSAEFVREIVEQYGEDDPMFDMMVAGNFPRSGHDTLIPLAHIEAAQARWATTEDGPTGSIGLDVGDQGSDETVTVEQRGSLRFVVADAVQGDDTETTAAKLIRRLEAHGLAPHSAKIDSTGIGNSVVSYCRNRGLGVVAVNFSESPLGTGVRAYLNRRAEIYFALQRRFRDGLIAIDPRDARLAQELAVIRHKVHPPSGKLQIVSKDHIKTILGRSPDRADGLALAAWQADVTSPLLTERSAAVPLRQRGASFADYRAELRDRLKGYRKRGI